MARNAVGKLPVEVILEFIDGLDPVSISKFSQTCKSLYDLLCQQRKEAARRHSGFLESQDSWEARRPPPPPQIGRLDLNRMVNNFPTWDPTWRDMSPRYGLTEGPVTHIFLALHEGRAGALRGYLEAGVDPNSVWKGVTLISEAACCENTDCIKILLDYGASPSSSDRLENGETRTPLARALHFVFRYALQAPGIRYSPVFHRIWKPEFDKTTCLFEAGFKISNVDEARYLCYQVNFLDVIKLAVRKGTDLSKLTKDGNGSTILHQVVEYAWKFPRNQYRFCIPGTDLICYDDIERVEWIITQFPELINDPDNEGQVPFDKAVSCRVGRADIARLLIYRGIELGFSTTGQHAWYFDFINGQLDYYKADLVIEAKQELYKYECLFCNPRCSCPRF